jgi:HK97 family phage major capsid protein
MPYHIEAEDSVYCVYKDGDPEALQCYDNESDAEAYLTALNIATAEETKAESDTHTPPEAVADNARMALEVRAEKPPSQRGMTPVGLARARQLANRQPVSVATLRRMASYFARHEVDKDGATWEEQGKGWQAWMGWGGDEGWAWARRIIEAEDTKAFDASHIMEIGGQAMEDTVKSLPTAVKAIGEYTVKGKGIVYGGFDLTEDRFTADTDLGGSRPFEGMPVFYDHAMGGIKSQIGMVKAWVPTDDGIDVEIELDRRHQYASEVMKLVEAGALGLSTGAVSHLVVRQPIKGGYEIKRWHVAEISLTPTPAEPRTTTEVKSEEVNSASMAADETMPDDTETTPDAAEVATESPEETKAMPEGIIDNARNDEPQVKAALPAAPSDNPFDSNEYYRAYKRFIDVKNPIEKQDDASDVFTTLRNATKAYAVKTQTEGTNNDGGFTAPTAVNRMVVARRDESSLLGKFRFMRVTTDTWKVVVPAQSTKATAAIVGEGVTATASEPNIANTKTIQLYKDTLEFAITEELLADTASNYEEFLMNEIARAMAVSVNTFIIKGTGSSQPYGIYARVTNDVPLGATTATSAQILSVSTGINGEYMTDGETGWIMRNATWGVARGLDLANTGMLLTSMEGGVRRIESWPVALSEQVDAYGTSTNEPLIFGNFNYYAFAERTAGVQIDRDYNPRTGVTYMIAKWRFGGDVTQPEAFAIGKHA